ECRHPSRIARHLFSTRAAGLVSHRQVDLRADGRGDVSRTRLVLVDARGSGHRGNFRPFSLPPEDAGLDPSVGRLERSRSRPRLATQPTTRIIAMYRKILVALENSRADKTLLPHVTELARSLGSELLLVHVADGW